MKKLLIVFVIILITTIGIFFLPIEGYKLYHWSGITYREMIIPFSNKKIKIKFTGKSLTHHSGTLTGVRREAFGKKHGKSTFYNKYPNSIANVTPYKDGKIDGIERVYYADGSLKYEIEYRNGHLCGSWKKYYGDRKTTTDSTVGIHYIYENDKKIKTLKQDVELLVEEFF